MINDVWLKTLEELINTGEKVSPRKNGTRELLAKQTIVPMSHPILTVKERNLNPKFLAAEAYWILSGSNRTEDIVPYLKNIAQFSDNGISFRGAYGPKVIEQLDYIVDSFIIDQDTRQAVLTIWRENPRSSKDIPCTVSMQWIIRKGKLHCNVNMRSSDIWLGWVYDVFNFSMISTWIALVLRSSGLSWFKNLELGNLYLTAGSQHIYNRDIEKAKACLEAHSRNHTSCIPVMLNDYKSYKHLMCDLELARRQQFRSCTTFMSQLQILGNLE